MKTIFKLSILLAVLAFASSCQDEAELNPPQPFEVSLSASSAATKTVLSGGKVLWESGDEVALVFTHPSEAAAVNMLSTSIETPAVQADFKGTLPLDLTDPDGLYNEAGYAVYPASAVLSDGSVSFELPAEQKVRDANGGFVSGMNLMSASVSLADIQDDGNAAAQFHNALSVLRFTVTDDITSVTLTGTSPMAGPAPVVFNEDGRLVIDGEWTKGSNSVTLKPADGTQTFSVGEVNLLVWPGTHTEISVVLNSNQYGDLSKTSTQAFTFEPSKYYTLNLNTDSEALIEELAADLNELELDLSQLENQLAGLETRAERISALVNQIQSVAFVSDYIENAAYAYYANQSVGMMKMDVKLNYIVRPAAAMSLLIDLCKKEGTLAEVLKMVKKDGTGSFAELTVKDAMLDGDVLTVVVDAQQFDKSFYDGHSKASVALQISDGNTDVLSEFARLIPKVGNILNLSRTDDIPVLKGASFSMSYQYGAEDYAKCQVSVQGTGFSSSPSITAANGTGFISASFEESDNLADMSITVTYKYDGNLVDEKILTFEDGGVFNVAVPDQMDYIGGEVALEVTENSFGSYNMHLSGAGDWIYETSVGVGGRYTINLNEGSERSANVVFTITNGSITYTKSVPIVQKAVNSPITGKYYSNGDKVLLNQKTASCANALNIVILGDGYQKKDLLKGGKFERSAKSAMDSFFGIEPYKTFKDRFNVYMVAYESTDEGIDNNAAAVDKNTYFDTYWAGGSSTAAYTNSPDKVIDAVKNVVGSSDANYYRTIAIVLANTSEQAGSCGYPYRDKGADRSVVGEDWKSFSICVLAANSTGTNGLVKHEAGGHAFGRLADEYYSGSERIPASVVAELDTWHSKGWYFNVCTDGSYWNLFIGMTGYEDVGYVEGAYNYASGVYRPTTGGMMQDNVGVFNAPSRRAIYQRIIRQTEGYDAYSDAKFLEYDKKNL